jgi:hypothetical protein
MVTILAFLVLGGGTALASYVISSNSEVGPGTISGHHPPSGDHANVIGGSINGTDVLESSLATVPSATDANHATNSDKLGGSLPSAFLPAAKVKKVDAQSQHCFSSADAGCHPTILSVGGGNFTLSYECSAPGFEMKLTAHAGGANANVNWFYVHNQNGGSSAVSNGGVGTVDATVFDLSGALTQAGGQIVYRDDSRVVSVPFQVYISSGLDQTFGPYANCQIEGTSTEANS